MIGNIVFFAAGFIVMGLITIPLLNSRSKKIRSLENENGESVVTAVRFRDRAVKLAANIRDSVGELSRTGSGGVSGMEQAGSMGKIETTLHENAHIAAEIVEKTRSVATIASKTEEDVLLGFSILEKNIKKMGDIKEKNSGVINGIILLSNKVNKIRDIVRIITTITDQTKVIAFNAALEAASAGETGRRFAVVAGEVNRLADDIAVLTRQIREQVEEIQSSSSSLIVYSEEGSDRISEGYKLIKDLEDVFREIRAGAEITSNQAQTITVSTQKQLKSSEQIHDAIADVSQDVKHLAGAAEVAALSTGNLKEQVLELEKFLQENDAINGREQYGA